MADALGDGITVTVSENHRALVRALARMLELEAQRREALEEVAELVRQRDLAKARVEELEAFARGVLLDDEAYHRKTPDGNLYFRKDVVEAAQRVLHDPVAYAAQLEAATGLSVDGEPL